MGLAPVTCSGISSMFKFEFITEKGLCKLLMYHYFKKIPAVLTCCVPVEVISHICQCNIKKFN